jgi:hypothetical protein
LIAISLFSPLGFLPCLDECLGFSVGRHSGTRLLQVAAFLCQVARQLLSHGQGSTGGLLSLIEEASLRFICSFSISWSEIEA